jgi:hypothetical protein
MEITDYHFLSVPQLLSWAEGKGMFPVQLPSRQLSELSSNCHALRQTSARYSACYYNADRKQRQQSSVFGNWGMLRF